MWNVPSPERLAQIPPLYQTEADSIPLHDKLVHFHFFVGDSSDWYAVEFDGTDIFWGFAILNNDLQCAEWGYFSLAELQSLRIGGWLEVDCDLYWQVRPAGEVDRVRECHPHWRVAVPA